MRSHHASGAVATAVVILLAGWVCPCFGCLRDTLDDRAVQWSTQIVMANLTAIHDPVVLSSDAESGNGPAFQYQTYDFQVTNPIDGTSKVGDSITVVRFIMDADTMKSSICGQAFTPRHIGKAFLLMLRPESQVQWSDRENGPDPRSSDFHAMKTFMVVHLELASDLGDDGIADAEYTVKDTRAAEAQYKDADAKLQIQTFVNAQDDTEEGQAEKAILDMGPKALPAIKAILGQTDEEVDQSKLRRLIRELSPPSVLASMHEH